MIKDSFLNLQILHAPKEIAFEMLCKMFLLLFGSSWDIYSLITISRCPFFVILQYSSHLSNSASIIAWVLLHRFNKVTPSASNLSSFIVTRGQSPPPVPLLHLHPWLVYSWLFLPTWQSHRRSSISTMAEGLTLSETSRESGQRGVYTVTGVSSVWGSVVY